VPAEVELFKLRWRRRGLLPDGVGGIGPFGPGVASGLFVAGRGTTWHAWDFNGISVKFGGKRSGIAL
jgi:hypothetical protein